MDGSPTTRTGAARELDRARRLVAAYAPRGPEDAEARERILAFVDLHPDALLRTCLAGHLTASALLLDGEGRRCLLHHHAKLDRWLQFGGHADGQGDLLAVARRETEEESGILPHRIGPEPVDLDVHVIPARGDEPEHLHLDVRFLAHAPAGARAVCSEESRELAWFEPRQALELAGEDSLARLVRRAFGLG